MASTNQGPEYFAAERQYSCAQTIDDKVYWLEQMIKNFKKHKSSEKMLAELKTRLIKLREKKEKSRSVGKTTLKSIRKEGPQAALVGFTNSGKSSILNTLTNTSPEISEYPFTTKEPLIGAMDYDGVKIQIIDLPAITHESFDKGLVNSADLLIIVINNYEELSKIQPYLERAVGKRLIVLNKSDSLDSETKRKSEAKLMMNKGNFVIFSSKTLENLEELKKKIFKQFDIMRIYTKEPHKERSPTPIIMKPNSTVEKLAEKIYKGMSGNVKETRIWGPSSKFSGQSVGLKHELKDLDTVEFKTK